MTSGKGNCIPRSEEPFPITRSICCTPVCLSVFVCVCHQSLSVCLTLHLSVFLYVSIPPCMPLSLLTESQSGQWLTGMHAPLFRGLLLLVIIMLMLMMIWCCCWCWWCVLWSSAVLPIERFGVQILASSGIWIEISAPPAPLNQLSYDEYIDHTLWEGIGLATRPHMPRLRKWSL